MVSRTAPELVTFRRARGAILDLVGSSQEGREELRQKLASDLKRRERERARAAEWKAANMARIQAQSEARRLLWLCAARGGGAPRFSSTYDGKGVREEPHLLYLEGIGMPWDWAQRESGRTEEPQVGFCQRFANRAFCERWIRCSWLPTLDPVRQSVGIPFVQNFDPEDDELRDVRRMYLDLLQSSECTAPIVQELAHDLAGLRDLLGPRKVVLYVYFGRLRRKIPLLDANERALEELSVSLGSASSRDQFCNHRLLPERSATIEVTTGPGQSASAPSQQGIPEPLPGGNRKRKALEHLAQAMLLVQSEPGLSNAQIARAIGVSPSTLSRSQQFKQAAALARGEGGVPPSGFRTMDGDTGLGGVEAVAKDGDDPDAGGEDAEV